jgi:gamma-glutamylcyclotransferase (GGCT)/AIG2-like uncharacterized protein YtfP
MSEEKKEQETRYRVFVYGTLKRGGRLHGCMDMEGPKGGTTRFIDEYTLGDVEMYNLGWYPGIKQRAGGKVHGELYSVTEDVLKRLDRVEGAPFLYSRKVFNVPYKGVKMDIHTYVFNGEVNPKNLIVDGVWRPDHAR